MFGKTTAAIFTLVFTIFMVVYLAWPTLMMWGWFAVPLGLPVVSMAHMLGLIMLVGLLNGAFLDRLINIHNNSVLDMDLNRFLKILAAPLVVVGLGYIVKSIGGL